MSHVAALVRWTAACTVALAAWSAAQDVPSSRSLGAPAATLSLGVADRPVADRWNPLRVVVRNVGEATVTVTFDDPSATTPPTFVGTIEVGGGLGVIDLDLPIPNVSAITWSIEADGAVLASGAYGAREVRSRPLQLLLSSRTVSATAGAWADESDVRISIADLPRRAASFDGVARLVIDGTTPAPEPETLVTAASAGVTVVLPDVLDGAYVGLSSLTSVAGRPVGAGTIVTLASDATGRTVRPPWDVVPALDPPRWPHRTRTGLAVAVLLHLAVVLVLVQVQTASARSAGVVWIVASSAAGWAWFGIDGSSRATSGVLAESGSQIARRTVWSTTTDPHGGTLSHAGIVRPESPVTAVRWSTDTTDLDVPGGSTTTVSGPPEVAFFATEQMWPIDTQGGSTRSVLPPGWRRLPTPIGASTVQRSTPGVVWATDGVTAIVIWEDEGR